MRTLYCLVVFALVALGAAPAQAQFANRSVGVSGGYISFERTAGLDSGAYLGLDASLYLEGGFEMVSLTKITFPRDPVTDRRVVGVAPSLGLRYLFSEESVRPYVGADVSYLYIFKEGAALQYVGLGPTLGLDVFATDSLSLGARAQYNFYLSLNQETQNSLILGLGASAYF